MISMISNLTVFKLQEGAVVAVVVGVVVVGGSVVAVQGPLPWQITPYVNRRLKSKTKERLQHNDLLI